MDIILNSHDSEEAVYKLTTLWPSYGTGAFPSYPNVFTEKEAERLLNQFAPFGGGPGASAQSLVESPASDVSPIVFRIGAGGEGTQVATSQRSVAEQVEMALKTIATIPTMQMRQPGQQDASPIDVPLMEVADPELLTAVEELMQRLEVILKSA